jgi:hypothetical protein
MQMKKNELNDLIKIKDAYEKIKIKENWNDK